MYLDGFSGDVLNKPRRRRAPCWTRATPCVRCWRRRRRSSVASSPGVPTTDEEAYPDREASRKARHKAERDAVPLAEKLWAMRNAAAQMGASGSKGQARSMLEEAYQLRAEALAKRRAKEAEEAETRGGNAVTEDAPGGVAPELLPELTALEDLFASEKAWARGNLPVRAQVLKAVRTAADRAARAGDAARAAALLEGAARGMGGEEAGAGAPGGEGGIRGGGGGRGRRRG